MRAMTPYMYPKERKEERGFTTLFAVLVASLLLAIGIAIFNITYKELLLSSAARESQFAIYAADTGIECALYWDFKQRAFATGTAPRSLTCLSQSAEYDVGASYPATSTFSLQFPTEPYCVTVEVGKYSSPARTIVISRGYNTCDESNPRRVERALRAIY